MRSLAIGLTGLFILFSFALSAQNDTIFVKQTIAETDTIVVPADGQVRHILVGTTFLPYSKRHVGLLNSGIEPICLEKQGQCDGRDRIDTRKYPQMAGIERSGDSLIIEIVVASYCGDDFLGDAEIRGDTLHLFYTSYGDFAACTCCYTLRYVFGTQMEAEYTILNYVAINEKDKITTISKL